MGMERAVRHFHVLFPSDYSRNQLVVVDYGGLRARKQLEESWLIVCEMQYAPRVPVVAHTSDCCISFGRCDNSTAVGNQYL